MRADSDRIHDLFAAGARDLTPASVRHTACMLYSPVASDPEVTRLCASVLSDTERQRADRFARHRDKVLFIQRRAFRRFCGATVLGSLRPLSEIAFQETENGRPYLSHLPDFWFSFSSCRLGFLGAWSSAHAIGVDFEDQTRDLETLELAQRFFAAAEASAVEEVDDPERSRVFYRFWSLKEAALKSIGEGLPYGLDAFVFELTPNPRVIDTPPDQGGPGQFNSHLIEGPERCAALVTRDLI